MALKKTIASFRNPDGTWTPQEDVEVGPLEEAAIRADWARGESKTRKPNPYTTEEEMKLFLECPEGIKPANYVRTKKLEREIQINEWQTEYESLQEECNKKWAAYEDEIKKHPTNVRSV